MLRRPILTAVGLLHVSALPSIAGCNAMGGIEEVHDERAVPELRKLPVVASLREISRDRERGGGCVSSTVSTSSATYALGEYRVSWAMDSDRGRPGPATVRISRGGGGLVHEYESFGNDSLDAVLRHDPVSNVDVLILPAYPSDEALVFRAAPRPK